MIDTQKFLLKSIEPALEGPNHLLARVQISALCVEVERLAAIAAALHMGIPLVCPECEAPRLEYHLTEREWWCGDCSLLSPSIVASAQRGS